MNLVEKDIKPSLSSGSEEQLKTSIALCGTLALYVELTGVWSLRG
jgi:hypothetical protein